MILLVPQQSFFWNDSGREYSRGISLFIITMVRPHSFKKGFNIIATTSHSTSHSSTLNQLYNCFFPSRSQSLAILSQYVPKSGVFGVSKLALSIEVLGRKGHISCNIFEEYVTESFPCRDQLAEPFFYFLAPLPSCEQLSSQSQAPSVDSFPLYLFIYFL